VPSSRQRFSVYSKLLQQTVFIAFAHQSEPREHRQAGHAFLRCIAMITDKINSCPALSSRSPSQNSTHRRPRSRTQSASTSHSSDSPCSHQLNTQGSRPSLRGSPTRRTSSSTVRDSTGEIGCTAQEWHDAPEWPMPDVLSGLHTGSQSGATFGKNLTSFLAEQPYMP